MEKVDKTNPEESFCQKVGEALTAGAAFVEGAFETIDVSLLKNPRGNPIIEILS